MKLLTSIKQWLSKSSLNRHVCAGFVIIALNNTLPHYNISPQIANQVGQLVGALIEGKAND